MASDFHQCIKLLVLPHEIVRFQWSKVTILKNIKIAFWAENVTDFVMNALVLKKISLSVV